MVLSMHAYGSLDSYGNYRPALEPEQFDRCPVLLTQPPDDHWTPLHLSTPFLSRIRQVEVETVLPKNAGHYPLEDPGLQQMEETIANFVMRVASVGGIE